MRRIGIDSDSLVVIYDDANALAAARMWWLLSDAGSRTGPGPERRSGRLDGGRSAAGSRCRAGGAGRRLPRSPWTAGQRIDGSRLWPRKSAARETTALADVRAHERFTGATEPMDPVAGHIPGAVSLASMANLDEQGRFGPPGQIRERYRRLDAGEGTPIFYCGSGITAAHTLLARESAGLSDGMIYPGSWSDWISDPNRPVVDGEGDRY